MGGSLRRPCSPPHGIPHNMRGMRPPSRTRDYAAEQAATPDGLLIVDGTGF